MYMRGLGYVLLLLNMALPVFAAPFSHKLHLQLVPQCVACHATVGASTKAADNNLPVEAACKNCHATRVIKQPEKLVVSHFNHQLHLKFGNVAPIIAQAIDKGLYLTKPGDLRAQLNTKNACAACHRGLEKSESLIAKAAFPAMADCLVCHTKIDAPFSCEKCHDSKAAIKPTNHTADFLDSHNRKNHTWDKETCAVCHGRTFTCLGCH